MKNKILYLIIILLVIVIVVLAVVIFNINNEEKNEKQEDMVTNSEYETLDNSEYIGIYSYSEEDSVCSNMTTLILTSDYQAIFYVGNCDIKSYYIGKYYVTSDKIYLYSLVLEDSSNDIEEKVDEEIYFNIVSSTRLTSIFGRSSSIPLEKLYNIV